MESKTESRLVTMGAIALIMIALLLGRFMPMVVSADAPTLTPQSYLPDIAVPALEESNPPSGPIQIIFPTTMSVILHYTQPDISNIEGRISSDLPLPMGKTVVHTSGLGDASARPIGWPVGDFTGFYPVGTLTDYQRGVSPDLYGSSAVQWQGSTVGMQVHSYSSPVSSPYRLALLYYAWPTSLYPWKASNTASLCIDQSVAVPSSSWSGGSINYAYVAFAVEDMVSRGVFWIQMDYYDSRDGAAFAEIPIWWPEANSAIALGYYGGQRYSSLLPTSHRSTGQTWNEWRYYGVCISREQFQNIAWDINQQFNFTFSTNPDDYSLHLFAAGPEMFTGEGMNGHMAARLRDTRVFSRLDD